MITFKFREMKKSRFSETQIIKNLKIKYPNQVWAIDITYIPVQGGYLYLVAIIDLYSRYVVNWSLSNTMSSHWCTETLKEAVRLHGKPEIINTDQGSQFTATEFSECVADELEIRLRMDGKGQSEYAEKFPHYVEIYQRDRKE